MRRADGLAHLFSKLGDIRGASEGILLIVFVLFFTCHIFRITKRIEVADKNSKNCAI